MNPFHWLRTRFGRAGTRCRAAKGLRTSGRYLLQLETLESRLAPAQITYVWTNADGNGLWSDGNNWTNGGPASLAARNTAVLQFNASTPTAMNDDLANLTVDEIHFTAIGGPASAGYSITGTETINFGSAATPPATIVGIVIDAGTSAQTASNNLTETFSAGITLNQSGLNAASKPASVVNIDDNDSGTILVVNGPVTLGPTSVTENGNITAGSTAVTGLASTNGIVAGETVTGAAIPAGTTVAAVTGPTTLTLSNISTVSGTFSLTFSASFDLAVNGAGTVSLNGVVSGTAGIDLNSGFLNLNADNTYAGATNVNGGTLTVNGTQPQSPINLDESTLAGTGTVGTVNSVGGTVSPGVGGPGLLSASSVFLDPTSTFAVQIAGITAGSSYSQLAVARAINLANATLSLTDNEAFPIGSTFTIVQGAVGSSTFAGLPDGSIIALPDAAQFQINYTTTGVVLTLLADPIVISPPTLPAGQVGVAFSQTITATNGNPPFTFTITDGALPAGLTLAANGVLSGTPTASGAFNFTVQASYVDPDLGLLSQTQSYALTIDPAVLIPVVLPNGLVAVPYDASLAVSGGGATFAYAVTAGSLPPGLSLDPNSGLLGGPFATAGGTYNFTVTANSALPSVTQSYTVAINPPNFSYDIPSKTLTITGAQFTFSQAFTSDGRLNLNYTFTMDGYSETLPDTTVAHVVVVNPGPNPGSATLFTNGAADMNGAHDIVLLGPLDLGTAGGNGLIQQVDKNGNATNFLQLYNFPTSVAFVGPADNGRLYGSSGVTNTLYTVGSYSYMESPGVLHYISGAAYVYGYAAGPHDTQLLFDGSGPTAVVISGTAYGYASGTDNGQAFFNEGVGFHTNEGIAQHPGQDIAYMIDSPGNDVFVGLGTNSYMYSTGSNGAIDMLNEVFGFAMVYAESFVGGIDFAYIYDSSHNVTSGFDVLLDS